MECLSSRREREAPGGRARENRKFIQAPTPEIWSETISGGEEVLAGKWGGLFLGYLLGKNYRRHDRDHLVPLDCDRKAEVSNPPSIGSAPKALSQCSLSDQRPHIRIDLRPASQERDFQRQEW
jgi:hypothetical protein